jgi:hypothetical protein
VRIRVDRTFTFEVYFIVKHWRPIYRHFNRLFADIRRRVSLVITDEVSYGQIESL